MKENILFIHILIEISTILKMESIGKTKKIVKEEKQANISSWLRKTDPWANVQP
jgi:hypothetical protein